MKSILDLIKQFCTLNRNYEYLMQIIHRFISIYHSISIVKSYMEASVRVGDILLWFSGSSSVSEDTGRAQRKPRRSLSSVSIFLGNCGMILARICSSDQELPLWCSTSPKFIETRVTAAVYTRLRTDTNPEMTLVLLIHHEENSVSLFTNRSDL